MSTGDYDGDGWLDLYVANDATPNQLWINQKNGTFADMGPVSGAAVNASGNPEGSMGIASGDYDADGDEDLFVTNIVGETYALYVNNGRGDFDDQRVRAGLAQPTAAFTGFGVDWFDYDNDGWLDLFAANGAVNVIPSQRGEKAPFRMINQLFRNLGATTSASGSAGGSGSGSGSTTAVRFADMTAHAGPAFARPEVNRAAAFGDIDNDGDVDVLVTTNAGPVRLLLNQASQSRAAGSAGSTSSSPNHWLQIRLDQPGRNRFALGARVGIERAGKPTLWRRVRHRRQLSLLQRPPPPHRPRRLLHDRRRHRRIARSRARRQRPDKRSTRAMDQHPDRSRDRSSPRFRSRGRSQPGVDRYAVAAPVEN